MRTFEQRSGYGLGVISYGSGYSIPTDVPVASPAVITPTVTKTSIWDKLTNLTNNIATIGTTVSSFTNPKPTVNAQPITQNQLPGGNLPTTKAPMSTATKVAIGVGVAAVVGGVIYAVKKKKKK
jgi:hypothetical protein